MAKQKLVSKQKKKKKTEDKLKRNYTKYKKELEKLEQKYNGMLSPNDIIREAVSERSPLHDWFDWQDAEAGEKWRIHQARLLLNSIKVIVQFEGGTKTYRKYLNVTVNTGTESKKDLQRFYVSTSTVLKKPELRQQVVERAIKEADYWRKTYEDYLELQDIFKGIKKTKKKLGIKDL